MPRLSSRELVLWGLPRALRGQDSPIEGGANKSPQISYTGGCVIDVRRRYDYARLATALQHPQPATAATVLGVHRTAIATATVDSRCHLRVDIRPPAVAQFIPTE